MISTIKAAAQASSDPTNPELWRARRDHFVDALDPSGHHGRPEAAVIRSLVEWLGEAVPSRESRQSGPEWERSVDLATSRLLAEL